MIGPHLISTRAADKAIDWIARAQPPLVKVIDGAIDRDMCLRIKAVSPKTMIVGRVVYNPQTIGAYGDFQTRVLSQAAAHRGHVDAWEGMNETAFHGDELRDFARAEAGLAKRLNDAGFIAFIGGFSAGFFDDGKADEFIGALRYCNDNPTRAIYHTHEYSAPVMQALAGANQWNWTGGGGYVNGLADPCVGPGVEGWTTLRYRKARRWMVERGLDRVRIAITESGIDDIQPRGGPAGLKGWKDYRDTEWGNRPPFGTYADQVAWYAARLAEDRAYVVGAVDFGFATIDPRWLSFDLSTTDADGEREKLVGKLAAMRHLWTGGTAPAPTPAPAPAPTPAWRPVVSAAVGVYAQPAAGEGAAAFAGRAAGHGEAPFGVRQAWAAEIAAANGLRSPVFNPGILYRLPAAWFKVREA